MRELSDKKLKYICDNYINGNPSIVRQEIKKLNKLQIANFISRSYLYNMKQHEAYIQVQFALE